MKSVFCKFAAVAALVLSSSVSFAQTDTQLYTITVPTVLQITAPTAATLTHDATDDDQAFSAETWVVEGNSTTGVNVSFATGTAFVHSSGNYKRDVQLDVAVDSATGPGTWTVDTATDVTDYTNSDEVATVAVSSDDAGLANINLTVTFKTGDFSLFAAGDYTTTITGTVAAN